MPANDCKSSVVFNSYFSPSLLSAFIFLLLFFDDDKEGEVSSAIEIALDRITSNMVFYSISCLDVLTHDAVDNI